MHIETVREIFELQRQCYNETKGSIPEETIEEIMRDKEGSDTSEEQITLLKGLLRNYPARPNKEDISKAKRLKEDQNFQELMVKLRETEEGETEEDESF